MGKMDWISSYRIVVFVPEAGFDEFATIISASIPSFLGPYDHVAWWSENGTEQFRPLKGAHPVSGGIGEVRQELSRRVELSLPYDHATLQRFVEEVIVPAHPWEKPVLYVYETTLLAP